MFCASIGIRVIATPGPQLNGSKRAEHGDRVLMEPNQINTALEVAIADVKRDRATQARQAAAS